MNKPIEKIIQLILILILFFCFNRIKAQTELKFMGGIDDGYHRQTIYVSLLLDDHKFTGGFNDGYYLISGNIELIDPNLKYAGGNADGYYEFDYITSLLVNNEKYFGGNEDGYYFNYSLIDVPFPIELISFTLECKDDNVILNWITATEINNYGFEIQKKEVRSQETVWNTIGFVEGSGNSNSPKEYEFIDRGVSTGKYLYRLKQIDNDGSYEYSNEIEIDLGAPMKFSLSQNYPNPFNPITKISWQSPVASYQTLKVYDVLGNEVTTLINEFRNAGSYEVIFDASSLVSGVYCYRLQAGSFVETRKMVLLK